MKIIVLEGKTSSGKTTTLSMVYATLVSKGATVQEFDVIQNNEPTEDFEALLYLPKRCLFCQRKRVAICSHGDISGNYNTAVSKYSGKADVLIIADSTSSTKTPPPYKVLQKTPLADSEVKANTTDCHEIVNLIYEKGV